MPTNKQKSLTGLKKARSHIDKVIKMVEVDAECLEILQQTRAIMGLLRSVQENSMKCHLDDCLQESGKLKTSEAREEMVKNITQVVGLVNK